MTDKRYSVFVYGTLRKGEKNHDLLKGTKRSWQQAKIKGSLYDTGQGYPAYLESGSGTVYGEIYEVDEETLAALDHLEGYAEGREDNLYERAEMPVATDHTTVTAYVYVLNKVHEESLKEKVLFHDWKADQWYKTFEEAEYFAFGSCMDSERIEKAGMLEHFSKNLKAGKLSGYDFTYGFSRPDGARADIKESGQDSCVEGIVYTLPREAVDYLFRREGVHTNHYRPVFVDVTIDGRIHENVLTFTVVDKQPCSAPPEHYAVEILRGAKGRLSDAYIDSLITKLDSVNYKGRIIK